MVAMPWEQTSTSIPPKRRRVHRTSARTWAASETSHGQASISPRPPARSRAVISRSADERAATTTVAPSPTSAFAIPRPMPLPPPVTMATFPSSSNSPSHRPVRAAGTDDLRRRPKMPRSATDLYEQTSSPGVCMSWKEFAGRRRTVGALRVLAVASLVAYATILLRPGAPEPLTTWLPNFITATAAALCLARAVQVDRERAAWLSMGAGLTVYTAGNLV